MSQTIQMYLGYVLQIVIALGLVNVWLVRFHKSTKYRGKGAENMQAEFAAYGLPVWFMYLIGVAKVGIAISMLAGFWFPQLVYPASVLLAFLMAGAVTMHLKVKDPLIRALPALLVLLMALTLAILS